MHHPGRFLPRERGNLSQRRHCEERKRRSNPFSLFDSEMDCFAEPVIGPRFARTRWLAMTSALFEI